MAHVKRVRFAIEEERCEDCWGKFPSSARQLRQQQRALDNALRLQRMEAAQLQQLQERAQQLEQQLSACQEEKAVLRGTVVRLELELRSASHDVEALEELLASARQHAEEQARLRAEEQARQRAEEQARQRAEEQARRRAEEQTAERLRKRQRVSGTAAADGARVTELERQLAHCQAQLRGCHAERDEYKAQLGACLAENVKLQAEASRRRSSGGSHPGEQQQQQQQPHQQQGQEQPEGQQGQGQQLGGLPAGGAAEVDAGSGAATAAVVPAVVQHAPGGSGAGGAGGSGAGGAGAGGAAPSLSSRGRDAAETLVEVRHGGPVAAQPAQERRKPSSDTQPS